jgi:acetyl esterase
MATLQPTRDPLDTPQPLHAESRAFLQALLKNNLKRYDELGSIEAARERSRLGSKLGQGEVDFQGKRDEYFVPSPEVKEGIPVYVYVPTSLTPNPPILVYCHGGGNVVGERLSVESTCQTLAKGAGCLVVNVEYRLAPEHKFPAGLDDACQVSRWVLDNKTLIGGGAASKVGISGDSAGGQIASGVAHDVPGLAFQVLIYPHVSARGDRSLVSFQEYKFGPVLHRDLIDWFENQMGDIRDWRHPRFANILRDKFDHLPACLFIVAECDPLRDDSYEYAKKLTAAGVHNELYLAKGAVHAFYTLPGIFVELCQEAHARTIEFIKQWGTATPDNSKI